MSDNIEKIFNSAKYAREHNINPADPETWDENYKKRQQELAGIIPKIESDINSIKEGIDKAKKSGKIK